MDIDDRALGIIAMEDIIAHWIFKDAGREWNAIVTDTETKELAVTVGPYKTGHWGHE